MYHYYATIVMMYTIVLNVCILGTFTRTNGCSRPILFPNVGISDYLSPHPRGQIRIDFKDKLGESSCFGYKNYYLAFIL